MRPPAATDVGPLAGVLLEVGALDADAHAVGQVEPAVDVERLVVLADLVLLRHVRIEVVLPVERPRLDRAVERRADAHRQLDRLAVEHRQRAGQAERDRVDVGVGLVAEPVRAAARTAWSPWPARRAPRARRPAPSRHRRRRSGRRHRSWRASLALHRPFEGTAATRNIAGSPSVGASTCTPTGRPSAPVPNGTLIAGSPDEVRRDRVHVAEVHRQRVVGLGAEREGDRRRRGREQHVGVLVGRGRSRRRSAGAPSAPCRSRRRSSRPTGRRCRA